ncbi:MAG: BrnA antitoxin family protein [Bryobacteraceae bacterium]
MLFTTPLTDSQRRSLIKLAGKPDAEIDYSDAPESEHPPSEIHVGRFFRPIKQLVSLRVDADVLAWFRGRGRGKRYQTYMNEVLRREMRTRAR